MRRRSTFIHTAENAYDPAHILVDESDVSFSGLDAAREERLTFGLAALPDEIVDVLTRTYELHVRWQSETLSTKSAPYLSSLSPGLHVHFTPQKHRLNHVLCGSLRKLFSEDLSCSSPMTSFIAPEILSTDFATASSRQYYSVLPSLDHFIHYIHDHICPTTESETSCHAAADQLQHASQLDLDYDTLSSTLAVTALWPRPISLTSGWSMNITNAVLDKTELGIFSPSPAVNPTDLQLEGFLLDVGEHDAPKPTLFFFPSRHHVLPPPQSSAQQYQVSFDQPTGLHPTMRISFASTTQLREPINKPAASTCTLHTYLTLPRVLFIDEYAFPNTKPDVLFQAANHVVALRSISGERDLEVPDYVVKKWGSTVLLQLDTPDEPTGDTRKDTLWDTTIPLHLRYSNATAGGQQTVSIPWPVVFWACTAEEGTKSRVNPFDRVNLGYDGLFGERTMFYHLEPDTASNGGRMVTDMSVPVLDSDVVSHATVETVTLLVVLVGFLFLAQQIIRGMIAERSWWSGRANSALKSDTKKAQ